MEIKDHKSPKVQQEENHPFNKNGINSSKYRKQECKRLSNQKICPFKAFSNIIKTKKQIS